MTTPSDPEAPPSKSGAWLPRWIELDILLACLAIAAGLWALVGLMDVALASAPDDFDTRILLAFRQPGHPDIPIGPPWLEGAVRDITALGSVSVLVLIVAATVIYFLLAAQARTALFIFLAVALGQGISSLLKFSVSRPRPELVSHLATETSMSFPSGHAMLSTVTYLTLGVLAARFLRGRVTRIYVLSLAILVTLMVGVSRVYLGVHWPSDVLAGWCAGLVWALLCWLAARFLQRGRIVAEEED